MTGNPQPIFINVRDLRDELRNVLDRTQFLAQRYIVTTHGKPMAQLTAPVDTEADSITATDLRIKSRTILEAVHFHGKSFQVLRYGKPAAMLSPVQKNSVKENGNAPEVLLATTKNTGADSEESIDQKSGIPSQVD